eukprot:gene15537-15684_t
MLKRLLLTLISTVLGFAAQAQSAAPTLRWQIGGGNLVTHLSGAPSAQMYQALNGIGAKLGRMDSYGWRDLNRNPTPHDFDAAMLDAYNHGITPILLLEYEGSYQTLSPPQPIGSYEDWLRAGKAYARRFEPNGDWAQEHGILNWGISIYTAINEPDVQASIPRTAYHDALAGFADGIHSINRALRVVPGGFATCNSHADVSLNGYGPAIADLLEDGRLDGIDLHTYYNARWFPLTKGHYFSAQSCFDRVKAALGLHRDIHFYATEFNVSRDDAWTDPKLAASLFLTALWDEMGVVGTDRHKMVSQLAFPWNLGDTGKIEGPPYAMAARENPWTPDARSQVLKMVLELAGDMALTQADPTASGTFTAEGPAGKMHIWQNRLDWTDRFGTHWDMAVPDWAKDAELWGWNGLIRHVTPQSGHISLDDLPANETYMLLLRKPKSLP